MLDLLTPVDESRHREAIDKIRGKLFRKYSQAEWHIVPASEGMIGAYAEHRWNAACGNYRVVRLGGLSYSTDCADPAGLTKFAVSHDAADRFNCWLSAAKGHTISAVSLRFRDLDEIPHRYVLSYRRANLAPTYAGQRRHRET